jgi:AcrR family transcriptional regulator
MPHGIVNSVSQQMKTQTRSKMVAGAADLIRRRGVNATSVREVVRHTDTPRGSIGHHFPRGKQQLVEDAVTYAGQEVSGPLERLMNEHGAVAGLHAFIDLWRNVLESSNYEAGCPVLAVAVEQYLSDDGTPNMKVQQGLLELARDIFDQWQRILSVSLRKEGVTPARARRLAALVVSSVEGTVALCRAARSSQPLNDVQQELALALSSAIAQAR